MIRPVAFLDFDDVLAIDQYNNAVQVLFAFRAGLPADEADLWQGLFYKPACSNLLTLHNEFEPEYVISSSWATFLSREQISEVLILTDLDFVQKNLHSAWTTVRDDSSYRLTEIGDWLESNNPSGARPYVILDDEVSGQSIFGSYLESNAVLCEPWKGLTKAKLQQAQKILRSQV